jgi:hypothetical protein
MQPQAPQPPPGWYASPGHAGFEQWWGGQRWTEHTRPVSADIVAPQNHPTATQESIGTFAITAGVVLVLIGAAMQFQSVSLLTGAGTLWIGAGLALGGVVMIFAFHGRTAIRAIAVIALVFCVGNVVYVEHQLTQKRQEIQQIFGS